ncbi:MAG TPA: secretin N-terminal domain-containing protein [Opitutaceae bacterium]|jgi:general secretion pathway protein D|nr:secretin N-terminal domain-containing protein [Opitutaceae bacterium]
MRPRFSCLAVVVLLAALQVVAEGPVVAGDGITPAATPAPAPETNSTQPVVDPPAATPPPAPAAPDPNDEPVTINLSDTSLDAVLQLLQMWTGLTVLRPQTLPTDNYSLVITKQIPKSEGVRALETLLGLHGIGVVALDDKFVKVIPLPQASREAPEMITGSTLDMPPSGRIAAKIFQLQFLSVNEIIPPIQQIMSPGVASPPVLFQNANAALIVDSVSNLQRIELLLQKVDQPLAANLSPRFYPVHNAQASDLVNKLHALFQGPLQAQIGSTTTYNADDRTNQIILISDPRQYPLFDSLIAKLDIKSDPNTRNEVIYLKHAVSKDVAPLLAQLISGQTGAVQKSGQPAARPGANNGEPAPADNQPRPNPTLGSLGVKADATQFSSYITVVPDDRSNAIVVSGTSDDIRLVREVVDKIDILLAQVSIQVVIVEVTLKDIDTTGLSALNLTVATDSTRGTHVSAFTGTIGSWNVTQGVVNPLAFQAALTDNGSKSLAKILSADTITTTHAKEADFQVTEQDPIITGSTSTPTAAGTTANTGFSTSSSVTYQNIGIEVKVTPLIGDDGSIQLTIDQKVDDITGTTTIDGNSQPIIGHREATSFVNVQDGEMVVLGGLQQTKHNNGRTKLGFFYEIPILSNLLGAHNNEYDRTELLFFVRPHVIPASNGTKDANKRIDELSNRDQVKQYLQDPGKPIKDGLIERYYK